MIRSALVLSIVLLASSPAFAADVDGKAVYGKSCANCHGQDGLGQTPAGKALKTVSLVDPQWTTPDALPKIEAGIRDGVPRMPAMKAKLTPEEITAAAHYVQQLAGGKP
jgi:cytochrome c6